MFQLGLKSMGLPTLKSGQTHKPISLAKCVFGQSIQEGPYSALEDAQATMRLYLWDRAHIEEAALKPKSLQVVVVIHYSLYLCFGLYPHERSKTLVVCVYRYSYTDLAPLHLKVEVMQYYNTCKHTQQQSSSSWNGVTSAGGVPSNVVSSNNLHCINICVILYTTDNKGK